MWDWGSEQQDTFEKADMLVKQIKALGICQAGILFELYLSVTLEGMSWTLWQRQQKERVPLGFWSRLWKGAET